MTELLTAAQMRAIETAAIESGAVTGLELMERAGKGVVDAIFAEWPALAAGGERGPAPSADASPPGYLGQDDDGGRRAVVLCGPGNNGGDGFVVARLLKEAGWDVDVFLYGDPGKLPPDAQVNYERWDGPVLDLDQESPDVSKTMIAADILVDALFGTGLSRCLPGTEDNLWPLFDRLTIDDPLFAESRTKLPRVVAIDVPSGVCSDSGKVLSTTEKNRLGCNIEGMYVHADLTVTFHRLKLAHCLLGDGTTPSNGVVLSGKIALCDIGIPETPTKPERFATTVCLTGPNAFGLRKRRLFEGAHKFTHGHALVLSGGVGKGGAARLAARGALRVGAGVVTLGVPPAALRENAAQLNAVMLATLKTVDGFRALLADPRINALCLGPGMGTDPHQKALLATALAQSGGALSDGARALVLDADALTMLSEEPSLFAALHDRCVLTPHRGEFARLFPDIARKLAAPAVKGPAYSKVDATRDAAARAGCVVLLKGPDTVIADPEGHCRINAAVREMAVPWLATAGAGDVLAGIIAGLLARGFPPMQAAATGAWLHAACARAFGPGLIAEDLPEMLPKVLSDLLGDIG